MEPPQPSYASGTWSSAAGFSGGGLQVVLGGINDTDILGMSGGWRYDFTLASPARVDLSFRYVLTQASEYESDEYSQAMVSVDGNLLGQDGPDYLAQITGNGNGGSSETTGWQVFTADLGTLASGTHTLVLGGYSNKKTYHNESSDLGFDDVVITKETVVNHPPTLANPGNQSSSEAEAISLALSATDPNGDPLTFTASGLPDGLSLNGSSGVVAGTLSFASAGSHVVDATVSDGSGSDSVSFTWTVANVNRPPSILNPGDQQHIVGASINLSVSASDPDGDTLSFSATGLPPGLTINSSSGEVAGLLTTVGSYNITVSASDGTDSSSTSFMWTISNVNQPPTPNESRESVQRRRRHGRSSDLG